CGRTAGGAFRPGGRPARAARLDDVGARKTPMTERFGELESEAGRHGRAKAVQDWLRARSDTRLRQLAFEGFRRYFEASPNSGCAATVYSSLSVLPAALVAAAYFHPSQSDANVFAQRLVTHVKLTGDTATLVAGTFGSASANALAATIAVVITFLLWGIGI